MSSLLSDAELQDIYNTGIQFSFPDRCDIYSGGIVEYEDVPCLVVKGSTSKEINPITGDWSYDTSYTIRLPKYIRDNPVGNLTNIRYLGYIFDILSTNEIYSYQYAVEYIIKVNSYVGTGTLSVAPFDVVTSNSDAIYSGGYGVRIL